MTAYTPSDEAIEEAGMRVWFALHPSDPAESKALRKAFGKGDDLGREWYLEVGRAALVAAYPHMVAGVVADAERLRELIRLVVSYDSANQSDLPLPLLDGLRTEVRPARTSPDDADHAGDNTDKPKPIGWGV